MAHIRDADGKVLLTYRSFATVIGIVATLVASIVLTAGLAAAIFLLVEKRPAAGAAAIMLALAFSAIISMLVPPIRVTLYDGTRPALSIRERNRFSFPFATFVVCSANGDPVAIVRRSFFARFGRNRWTVAIPPTQPRAAWATEESLRRAIVRKLAGKFSRSREANVRIFHQGTAAGVIVRRPDMSGETDYLDLTAGGGLDRRVAVALATLIFGLEP